MAPVILLPYDVGSPHQLLVGQQVCTISGEAAQNLRTFGFGITNDYEGTTIKSVTYQGYGPLNVSGALEYVREGRFKLSKKAIRLLEGIK